MALIVEDGTGVAGAESYVAVAAADAYFVNRGNTVWAALASATIKEQYLRLACSYMQQAYRGFWKGYRTLATQALDWPRQSVLIEDSVLNAWVDYHSVPQEVKDAQCELALRAALTAATSSAGLVPDITRQKNRTRIGDIEVEYDQFSPANPRYTAVDMILRPYIKYTGAAHALVRT